MSGDSSPIKDRQIGDYLIKGESIGTGGFAKVFVGMHIPTKERVAIKIIDKEELFSEEINKKRLLLEISILKKVRHKNIIKLYEIMETPETLYLVMEYCNTGELFDYIVSKDKLREKTACKFFQEIIDALSYLHSQCIIHRDIKPENILLSKINRNINCKLIDFGISRTYEKDKLVNTPCGTASYAPPEMHNGVPYNPILTDVWSAGVLLFSMVCGYLPFSEEDDYENIRNILKGNYEIPEDELSPELVDLIKHLLDINPNTRYNLEQIKQHPWYNIIPPNSRPGIIIGYHRIPIDQKIIKQCETYGYNAEEVIESVKKNKYNKNSAIYYILLKKMEMKEIESISDLYSEKYLEYINDKNNILTEEEINKFKEEMEENEKKDDKLRDLNDEFENVKDDNLEKISSDKSLEDIKNKDLSSDKSLEDIKNKDLYSENEEKKDKKESLFFSDDEQNDENKINNDNDNSNNEDDNNNNDNEIEEISSKKSGLSKNESNKEINTSFLEIENKNELNFKDDSLIDIDNEINNANKNEENNKDIEVEKNIEIKNDIIGENEDIYENIKENNDEEKIEEKEEKRNDKKKNNLFKSCRITKNKSNKNFKNDNSSNKLNRYHSFDLEYKINEMLNLQETPIEKNDELNVSFTIRLTDTIKENILKMKNPKKKDNMTNLKILKAIDELKNEKVKNIQKKHSKKVKFAQKDNFLSKGNKKEHTIIKNRNASVHLDKNKNNKLEDKITQNKNMHSSIRKTNKEQKYLKYKNNLKAENKMNKNNNINVINLNDNKKPNNMRISKKIEPKEKENIKNNQIKENNNLKNKIPKPNNINKKVENKSKYAYSKSKTETNNNITKRKNKSRNNNNRYTINIKSRNDKAEQNNKNYNTNTINMNSRNNRRIKDNNNKKLNNTFIIHKNKNNEDENRRPLKAIEDYILKNNKKENKKPHNNNNSINKYNTYNRNTTNTSMNKSINKTNLIELRKNKTKNNEINNPLKNRIDNLKMKKNERRKINNSTEFRIKFGNTLINKKTLDLSFDKTGKLKNKLTVPNTERKNRKEKIKIDKNNKYKGPLDTKNLIISDSIEYIQDKIINSLKLNKIKYWKLNSLKYSCCAKNMDKFFIEICFVSELDKYMDSIRKNISYENMNDNKQCLFYIKIMLSKDNNGIPNGKLLEKVINDLK